MGVKFTSTVKGTVTGIRFYKAAANTGTHVGSLWSSKRDAARIRRPSRTKAPPAGSRSTSASPVTILAGDDLCCRLSRAERALLGDLSRVLAPPASATRRCRRSPTKSAPMVCTPTAPQHLPHATATTRPTTTSTSLYAPRLASAPEAPGNVIGESRQRTGAGELDARRAMMAARSLGTRSRPTSATSAQTPVQRGRLGNRAPRHRSHERRQLHLQGGGGNALGRAGPQSKRRTR